MESLTLSKYFDYICPIPKFLEKYLSLDIFLRLKNISYFCAMDYASDDIYDFPYYISRYEHSISTALFTWKFSSDKAQTLAALFHDISAPCFSHVIDYMNGDFIKQESTEEKTEIILRSSNDLFLLLQEDNIKFDDIVDFSKYSIVDNNRPKLCADRLDGIFLPSINWTKNMTIEDTQIFIDDLKLFVNEDGEEEIGFQTKKIAQKAVILSDEVNRACHSKYDSYMMLLLAQITKYAMDKKIFTYDDLFILDEYKIINIFDDYAIINKEFKNMWEIFQNIKKKDIPNINAPETKDKVLNPLVNGKRLKA